MSASTAVIAAQAAQRRKLIRYFISQGAVSAEHGIARANLPHSSGRVLDRFLRQGVVRSNSVGYLYLDQRALQEADQARRSVLVKGLLIAITVMLLAAAVVFWTTA